MAQEELILSKKLDGILANAVSLVDSYVSKSDLKDLLLCDVSIVNEKFESLVSMDIYSMSRLAYNPSEGIVDKLVNVYSAMHSLSSSVFIIIKGNIDGTNEFYIGSRCLNKSGVAGLTLKKNFEGNFPGIVLEKKTADEKNTLLDTCFPLEYARKSLVTLSVSADFRHDKREEVKAYFQGIERFIDTMKGHSYSALFLAEPVSSDDCKAKKMSYENMLTELSKYQKVQVAYNEGSSLAVSTSLASSVTDTVSESISHSVSTNTSSSIGKSRGKNKNYNYDFFATGGTKGTSSGTTKTATTGSSDSDTDSKTVGSSNGTIDTKGETQTTNTGMNMTLSVENKHISQLMDKLSYELGKLDQADSYGLWDAAVYVTADSEDVALIAANSIRALMIGDESGNAESYLNLWGNDSNSFSFGQVGKIMKFLHYGMHPVFESKMLMKNETSSNRNQYFFTPAVSIGGNILPAFMGLPMKSVPGITVIEMAEFGRNVVTDNIEEVGNRKLRFGEVVYMGKKDFTRVELSVNSLSGHAFICGAPGSGKSNTIYKIIQELMALGSRKERDEGYGTVNFLVIEPTKGEYKHEFGNLGNVNIFTTKSGVCQLLKINPFEFPYEDMEVTTHISRLMNIISACWPLTAAMPAILKEALHKAYIRKGWDLNNSIYILPGEVKFPSFEDVLDVLPKIINNSGYSSEAKGDYIGALVTRVNSLVTGITGKIFNEAAPIDDSVLFDENTIIDLSDIGSGEAISLIMGILIMKLENYRRTNATRTNYPLRHVTILEEAHNVLPRNVVSGGNGSNVQVQSVKLISKAISEMRTYGEGFIIVDQSPFAVSEVAIANTSTKIIMRLPGKDDIEAAGTSVGLSETQKAHIAMLPQGQAIVKQGDWLMPIVVKVDKATKSFYKKKMEEFFYEDLMEARGTVLKKCFSMIKRNEKRDIFMTPDVNAVINIIEKCDIAKQNKQYMEGKWRQLCDMDAHNRREAVAKFVVDILVVQNAFESCAFSENIIKKAKGNALVEATNRWIEVFEDIIQNRYVHSDEDTFETIMFYLYQYASVYVDNESIKEISRMIILKNKINESNNG